MQIEQRKTDSLIPFIRNSRQHSTEQISRIAGSIREFGWTNPVLVDGNNGIIAGHGRVLAAQKLGITEIPCIELSHLSDTQKRAYIIADNRLAEAGASWDLEMLQLEIDELRLDGFDTELTGFCDDEFAELMGGTDEGGMTSGDTEPQIDQAEVLREKWGVEAGTMWLLGDHRILCGDSTNAQDVERVMGEDKPHLMVTDPPYGVNYDAEWRDHCLNAAGRSIKGKAIGKVINDDLSDWSEAWDLFKGDVAYVWHASVQTPEVARSLIATGFSLRNLVIWAKNHFAIGRGDYHHQHEPCWYAVRNGGKGYWQGDRTQTTLWEIDKPQKSETGHSTQKPIECMAIPIKNNSQKGDSVYEPFSGSGTTIIACENLGRKCIAIEIFPGYVAVALQRYLDHCGKTPVLIG